MRPTYMYSCITSMIKTWRFKLAQLFLTSVCSIFPIRIQTQRDTILEFEHLLHFFNYSVQTQSCTVQHTRWNYINNCLMHVRHRKYFFPSYLTTHFCSFNYNRLMSVSHESPFFRKSLKKPFKVSFVCVCVNYPNVLLNTTSASLTSDVHEPVCGHPCQKSKGP